MRPTTRGQERVYQTTNERIGYWIIENREQRREALRQTCLAVDIDNYWSVPKIIDPKIRHSAAHTAIDQSVVNLIQDRSFL